MLPDQSFKEARFPHQANDLIRDGSAYTKK